MKRAIPIWQLKDNISGVRIDKIDSSYISVLLESISELHRNDYFICIMLTTGKAELLVDFKKIEVKKEKLLFLVPGQIRRAIHFDTNSKGWILFLDNKIVDDHARLMIEDSLFKEPLLSLSQSELEWYLQYFTLLFNTYNDYTFASFHKSAVYSLAMPCIYKIAAAFQATAESLSKQYSQRKIELTKKYKRLVRNHYRDLKKPSDYAGLMHYSTTYLNDTIKSVTGFKATYFIQQEMLRESQRLLCYTDLSIKEISTELGYDDPKYFNRIFTKLTNVSPGRFRKDFKSHNTVKT
ncbi:helix-turn-helix domain-containing protein [Sphingobacterium thalpophilum]|nr:AraC family transcriptional regulator [Sphingobacterium thalpophilum]